MEIKSRDLSKDDFFLLFQELRPVPINYFNLFLAITAALLLSSAVQAAVLHLYTQHQLSKLQDATKVSVQQFNQSITTAQGIADSRASQRIEAQQVKLQAREQCFESRREYAANSTPANHASMAQACTNAAMPY